MPILPQRRQKHLAEIRKRLLVHRGWSYLRYVHLREAFSQTRGVRSVLAIGAGRGYAELALAVEFPEVRFTITELQESDGVQVLEKSRHLAETWKLGNVVFGTHDIVDPVSSRHDLVTSIEVLEHIEDEGRAAAEMRAGANRYVFALVPFADAELDADPAQRRRVLRDFGHHRYGYDRDELCRLFPRVLHVRGCYWADAGQPFRRKLQALDDESIIAQQDDLESEASADLREGIPAKHPESQGIWILAEV